mmetsp:Transcript_26476/g.55188  ORF Transcript_26476/g.55188 Transcript_26476/m.55188 type:complete len:225 (+) Transcript_26476:51-725(+)
MYLLMNLLWKSFLTVSLMNLFSVFFSVLAWFLKTTSSFHFLFILPLDDPSFSRGLPVMATLAAASSSASASSSSCLCLAAALSALIFSISLARSSSSSSLSESEPLSSLLSSSASSPSLSASPYLPSMSSASPPPPPSLMSSVGAVTLSSTPLLSTFLPFSTSSSASLSLLRLSSTSLPPRRSVRYLSLVWAEASLEERMWDWAPPDDHDPSWACPTAAFQVGR